MLVGLMGAGKTTVGQRCASCSTGPSRHRRADRGQHRAWAWPTSSPTDGEQQFRTLERDAVADASASPDPLVIACGGGAVLDADNRRRCVTAVWSCGCSHRPRSWRARRSAAAARARSSPAATAATLERLRRCASRAYEAAAHVQVDTEGRPVDQVAGACVEECRSWNG